MAVAELRAHDGALVCRMDGDALLIQHRWHGETRTTRVVPQATAMLQAALDAGGTQVLRAGLYMIHDALHVRRDVHLQCDDGIVDIVQMTQAPVFLVGEGSALLTSTNGLVRDLSGMIRMTNPGIEYVAPPVRPLDEVAHGDNRSAG